MNMRQLIKTNFFLTCSYYLVTNFISYIRYKTGLISTDSGTHHSKLSNEQSFQYIEEVFNDYKTYSGIKNFKGRVAEIGPGDNCGVGLLCLNDGSDSIDLVDRFYSNRNANDQAQIYTVLRENYPIIDNMLAQSDVKNESTFKGISRHYGSSASAELYFLNNRNYDFIISRAVFEHLYDPILALKRMTNAINPNGYLLHKVDLRDHEMFSNYHHELKFLEINEWLYRRMTVASGRPNRILINEYRDFLKNSGLEFKILVTRLALVGEITPHLEYSEISISKKKLSSDYVQSVRNKFCNKFMEVSNEDLSVTGIFIVAFKRTI